jgi:hypothetical protein
MTQHHSNFDQAAERLPAPQGAGENARRQARQKKGTFLT